MVRFLLDRLATSNGALTNFMVALTSSHITLVNATIKYVGYAIRGLSEFAPNSGVVDLGQTYSRGSAEEYYKKAKINSNDAA